MTITELDRTYVANTYKRFPVELVSGKGSLVRDSAGHTYIDMGSGIGVTAFGVSDESWAAAVAEQAAKLSHVSNLYVTEPCAKLAEMMCLRTGMKKVFFSNSGAEANECAIKVARRWAEKTKGEGHATIVTLENSFHGRTLTTLAATGQEKFHTLFTPLTPGFVSIKPGDMDALEAVADKTGVAAVLIECVQGEGGVLPLTKAFADSLAAFCERKNILLAVDEVQTGNGRTGALYAYMRYGLKPDIVSTAKGLGGGLPIGATMMAERVSDVLGYGDHGSTFGGNPIACAGALNVLGRIDDALLADVQKKSDFIFASLKGAPGVEEVTGLGLMIGIRTKKPAADVVSACREHGVLCLTAKDKVRLLPALNIPEDVLAAAVEVIRAACGA